jgi:hypothetical protein
LTRQPQMVCYARLEADALQIIVSTAN